MNIKKIITNFKTFERYIRNTSFYVIFIGVFFLATAVFAVFQPKIITLFFVSIFIFLGITTILIGLKIFQVYKNINKIIKKLKLD